MGSVNNILFSQSMKDRITLFADVLRRMIFLLDSNKSKVHDGRNNLQKESI